RRRARRDEQHGQPHEGGGGPGARPGEGCPGSGLDHAAPRIKYDMVENDNDYRIEGEIGGRGLQDVAEVRREGGVEPPLAPGADAAQAGRRSGGTEAARGDPSGTGAPG